MQYFLFTAGQMMGTACLTRFPNVCSADRLLCTYPTFATHVLPWFILQLLRQAARACEGNTLYTIGKLRPLLRLSSDYLPLCRVWSILRRRRRVVASSDGIQVLLQQFCAWCPRSLSLVCALCLVPCPSLYDQLNRLVSRSCPSRLLPYRQVKFTTWEVFD